MLRKINPINHRGGNVVPWVIFNFSHEQWLMTEIKNDPRYNISTSIVDRNDFP